ncbi:MAG: TonB-dependent receptor plug domain-containing protein [Flavobacteriales bacterium]|nr:TonB-dependent receptor plug domain-containing protein [Flavobacteriales bacterium]
MNLLGRLFLMATLLVAPSAFAQTITGKITDESNGELLTGVNIFSQDNVGASSDLDGAYTLKLTPGKHKVTYKFIGYEPITKEFNLKAGETVVHNVKMSTGSTALDLVVVTGSAFEKKVSDEMVTIDVVKDYLMENTAAPDLKAAVAKVPGVTIMDGQASIRGGGGYSYGVGSRVQMVTDNIPLLTGDLKDIQWNAIPMEIVDQIEVVKGASSVLYGSGAMNGVIHVRTGWATDKPETKFRIYSGIYGNPGQKDARWWDKSSSPLFTGAFFSHRRKIKNVDLVIGAHAGSDLSYLQRGQRQEIRGNWKTRVQSVKVKGLSYGLNGSVQYQQSGRFTLWANNTDGAYKPLDGTSSEDKYLFVNVDPWIQYSAGKFGIHTLRSRYYRVERRDVDWEDPSVSNVMYFDYRFQNEFKHKFTVTAGVQYQHIWSYSILYQDQGTLLTHNPSVYAQVEKRFLDRISLLVGVRDEWNNVIGLRKQTSKPIVRAGANFKVAKATNIRMSFGQSFRFPSIGEKFISASLGPIKILPNHDLVAESGWSAELGLKQGFKVSGWRGYFDFALFWTEFKNMVEYRFGLFDDGEPDPIIAFKPFNVTKARVAGVEFGLTGEGKLGPIPVRVYLGYTFNYPADLQADTTQQNVGVYMRNFFSSIKHSDSLTQTLSILKYRTTHVFKSDIEFDVWKFTVGYSCQYYSSINRIDDSFNAFLPGVAEYREAHTNGVWIMNARLLFKVSKSSTFGFITKNFMNEFYSLRPAIMEAPRSFALQYSLTL